MLAATRGRGRGRPAQPGQFVYRPQQQQQPQQLNSMFAGNAPQTRREATLTGTIIFLKPLEQPMFGFIRPADLALASSLVGSSGGSGDASQLYFNARQLQFENAVLGDQVEFVVVRDDERVEARQIALLRRRGGGGAGGAGGAGSSSAGTNSPQRSSTPQPARFLVQQVRSIQGIVEVPARSPMEPWGSVRAKHSLYGEMLLTYHYNSVTRSDMTPLNDRLDEDDIVQFVIAEDDRGRYAEPVTVVAKAYLPRERGMIEAINGSLAYIRPLFAMAIDGLAQCDLVKDYAPSVVWNQAKDRVGICQENALVNFSVDPLQARVPGTPARAVYVCEVHPSEVAEYPVDERVRMTIAANRPVRGIVMRDCPLTFMPSVGTDAPVPGLIRVTIPGTSVEVIATFQEDDILDKENEELVGSLLNVSDEVECQLVATSPFVVRATSIKHLKLGTHPSVLGRVETVRKRNGFIIIPGQREHIFFAIGVNGPSFIEGDEVEFSLISNNIQGKPTAYNVKRLQPDQPKDFTIYKSGVKGKVVTSPSANGHGSISCEGVAAMALFENRNLLDRNTALKMNTSVTVNLAFKRNPDIYNSTGGVTLVAQNIVAQRSDPSFDISDQREIGLILSIQDNFGFIASASRPENELYFFHFSEFLSAKDKLVPNLLVEFTPTVSKSEKRAVAFDVVAVEDKNAVADRMNKVRGTVVPDSEKSVLKIALESDSTQTFRSHELDIVKDMCGLRLGDVVSFVPVSDSKITGGKRAAHVEIVQPLNEPRVTGIITAIDDKSCEIWMPSVSDQIHVNFSHWIDFEAIEPKPQAGAIVDFVHVEKTVKKLSSIMKVHLATRVRLAANPGSVTFKQNGEVRSVPKGDRFGSVYLGSDDQQHLPSLPFAPEEAPKDDVLDVGDLVEFNVIFVNNSLAAAKLKRLKRKTPFAKSDKPQLAAEVPILRQPKGPDGTIGFHPA